MKIKKLLKRIGQGFLVLIIIALLSGFVYEQISRNKASKKYEAYKKYGGFIDVGGHSLFYCTEGKGKPTVVFESGFPGDVFAWIGISKKVSKHSTTVFYDRAGMLYSTRGNKAKNDENISDDLFTLLQKGGFEKPYILVGHSAAGIYLIPFAQKHEKDILGIVLIDPSHPGQIYRASDEIKKEILNVPFIPPKWLVNFANEVGLVRLASKDWMLYYGIKSGAIYDEFEYLMDESVRELPQNSFGDIPLVVISAGLESRYDDATEDKEVRKKMLHYWDELQEEIASSSSRGTRIIAEKSGHNMLRSERDLIINEIEKLIQLRDSVINE